MHDINRHPLNVGFLYDSSGTGIRRNACSRKMSVYNLLSIRDLNKHVWENRKLGTTPALYLRKTKTMFAKFVLIPSLAIALLNVAAPLPDALALSYTVSGGSVNPNTDDGLIIKYSLYLPSNPYQFSLEDGESETFNFFKIWTDETNVNPDDQLSQGISATLNFSVPATSATVSGLTFGGSILWGVTQWGEVVWQTPAPEFTAPDGRVFQVTLSNEIFNEGIFGLNEGKQYGAIVKATVKQIGSSYTSVPDNGSTAMLLGLSLLVIAIVSHRKVAI